MLDEATAIAQAAERFRAMGYTIRTQATGAGLAGFDVVAERDGELAVVEVKGDASMDGESNLHPYNRKSIFERASQAVWTALAAWSEPELQGLDRKLVSWIAVPDSPFYREYLERLEPRLALIDVRILWLEGMVLPEV